MTLVLLFADAAVAAFAGPLTVLAIMWLCCWLAKTPSRRTVSVVTLLGACVVWGLLRLTVLRGL